LDKTCVSNHPFCWEDMSLWPLFYTCFPHFPSISTHLGDRLWRIPISGQLSPASAGFDATESVTLWSPVSWGSSDASGGFARLDLESDQI
jgi:hypothetical protein